MTHPQLIQGCQRFDRTAQRQMFEEFYNLLFGIALRYSKNKEQAQEMFAKGFSTICSDIIEIKKDHNLESWLRKKMIGNCVLFLRSKRQEYFITSTVHLVGEEKRNEFDLFHQQVDPNPSNISAAQYLEAIQLLPPSFRAVYNLLVVDQYNLENVVDLLEISGETCKYNLNKAKETLFKNIQHLQNAA